VHDIALSDRLLAVERDLTQQRAVFDAMREQGVGLMTAAKEAGIEADQYEQACALLSKYADARQEEVRERLEGLVTRGLQAVFEEDLTFHIKTKYVGKRVDTEFVLRSTHDGQMIETGIMDARGGGVAAVTGFLLQVILLILHGAPRVLFLDESFAQVSAEYEPRLAAFMDELATDLSLQVVMVTHSTGFEDVSDVVYRTSAPKGVTKVERVR
jgi:hypothetical protein